MSDEQQISSDEAWYDAEIAPVLLALAARCKEHGMSFIANVEYEPEGRAGTYSLTEGAGLAMRMVYHCASTAPNIDGYVMATARYCRENGIDTSASFVMRALDGGNG